jgi:hypothetical protein
MAEAPPDTQAAAAAAYSDLDPRERRRVLLVAGLRTVVSLGIMIGIFAAIPPRDVAAGNVATGMIVGFVLLLGLVGWEIYRTVNDPYPEVRAGTGLLVLVTAVVVIFSLTYATMAASDPGAFTAPMEKSDAVYFTVTTLSTTGFGDITAVSQSARWVVTAQMLFDLILLVGLARVFILAAKAGRARRAKGL